MDVFPTFFRMRHAKIVLFGGGEEARRKARLLAKTPAEIIVVADVLEPDFAAEVSGCIVHRPQKDENESLRGAAFAIIAVEDDAEAARLKSLCEAAGVPANVVDRPALCDFTVPSIVDRGAVVAAIATGGAAPVLARTIRVGVEGLIPDGLGRLAEIAAGARAAARIRYEDAAARRRLWERVFEGDAARLAAAGDLDDAERAMLAAFKTDAPPTGSIELILAPSTADDLTLRAVRAMGRADVLMIGEGVPAGVLDLARRDAERAALDAADAAMRKAAGARVVVLASVETGLAPFTGAERLL